MVHAGNPHAFPVHWWRRIATVCILVVVAASSLFLGFGLVFAVGGTAPNGPGSSSVWTPSTNSVLGTAANTTSDVWFTGYNGIIGEVYYPTVDTPNSTDLQFLIGSSGHTWVDEEKVATTSTALLYNSHSLAWTVTNTATRGSYKITKTIYTDPARNTLIQDVTFTALTGHLSDYNLYVLYNPTIHNAGDHNTSSTQVASGRTMLVSTDSSGQYASALAADFPYLSGMTSSGFVGQNDGWTDLKGSTNCGSGTCPDYTMSYTYSPANNGNTAQTGQIDLSDAGAINLTTATSATFRLGLGFGQGASAVSNAESALNGTLGDATNMLNTYVSQWNTFDNSLTAPPLYGSTTAIKNARQQESYLATNILKASQDKTTNAIVAAIGTPWGDTNGDGDVGGYHLVWARDMYEIASALIVAGDTTDAKNALLWEFNSQQQSDGHFPQNSFVNGTPNWTGIQEDESAFPILLAWKLGVTDSTNYTNHIKPAANYIIEHGPWTGEERWEENGGYSPSTIAAEIAGLLAASSIASTNGDTTNANRFASYADYYQAMIEDWTFTTSGSLSGGSYYERIDDDANPNDGHTLVIGNGGGSYDERNIADAGFLELVRQGVKTATDPYITASIATVDATIKQTIGGNAYWFRYNHDGYGENTDGSNYDGTGVGQLWPIFSGERGIYTVETGASADAYLTAMTASENASGFIPEQIWDSTPPSGFTAGTPTKSMDPLNWSMAEYVTLLYSAANGAVADQTSLTTGRYVSGAYTPHTGWAVDYNSANLAQGKALTIYYHGSLDNLRPRLSALG